MNQVCIYSKEFLGGKPPVITEDFPLASITGLQTDMFEVPFMRCISPQTTPEEVAERFPLGAVGDTQIERDGFGCVYINGTRLSNRIWTVVGDMHFLARPFIPSKPQPESGLSKLWRRIRRFDCQHCSVFDHDEGLKWRHTPTHAFDDGSTAAMWDDVLSMVADDKGVNVIPDTHIGYCRLRKAIIDARNKPCVEFCR